MTKLREESQKKKQNAKSSILELGDFVATFASFRPLGASKTVKKTHTGTVGDLFVTFVSLNRLEASKTGIGFVNC